MSSCSLGGKGTSSGSNSQEPSLSENTSVSTSSEETTTSEQSTSTSEETSTSESSSAKLRSISLNTNETDLIAGKQEQLTVTYDGDGQEVEGVIWSSDDEDVATVKDGLITAIGKGVATITATSIFDNKISDTCIVNVKDLIIGEGTISINNTYTDGSSWKMQTSDFLSDELDIVSVSTSGLYGTGANSVRVAAARASGSLTFNFDARILTYVKLHVSPYISATGAEDETSIKVSTSSNTVGQTLSISGQDELLFDEINSDLDECTSFTIASNSKNRFFLNKIDLGLAVDKAIYPTSIALSTEETTIAVNKTTQLSVSYSPIKTNQKFISFSSNKESVAIVDEKGLVTGLANGVATITASALKEDGSFVKDTIDITVDNSMLDKWTIMIYMCGSDLESENGLATEDLKEIVQTRNQPDDVNIIIEAGGASSWESTYSNVINANKLNRFHLENRSFVKDEQIARANMGSSSTFQSFLEWGLNNYPAEKTGVILWNHGGGMQGCCFDEFTNDYLDSAESLSAVKGAFNKTGTTKLEWIGYDCCLMQTQEYAEINSPYFNYMIASQESESGYGWDYDHWLDDLYSGKDTETILTEICDTFIEDNGGANATGEYYEGDYYACDQTLSYLDLNYMSAYKEAWEEMASKLKDKIASGGASNFRKNVIGKTKYFAGSDYQYFGEFDAYHLLTILENNSTYNPGSSYIKAVKTAFNNLVKHNAVQKEAAHDAYGLSVYFYALTGYGNLAKDNYSHFTIWNSICANYGGTVNSTYKY